MPWTYAAKAGIVKKWADKCGITIEVTQINDYIESINAATASLAWIRQNCRAHSVIITLTSTRCI